MTMWYGACDTLLNIGVATFTTTVTDPAVAGHLHVTATYNGEVIATDAAGEWRFPEGDNVVTWTVTDTCGFSLSCEQHVVVHFPPCGPGHEVAYDGHTYQTVRVGCECWLKENLRNTKYADGTDVPSYSSYEHSAQNEADFGMLYSWYSAMNVPEWDNSTQPSTQAGPNGLDYIQGGLLRRQRGPLLQPAGRDLLLDGRPGDDGRGGPLFSDHDDLPADDAHGVSQGPRPQRALRTETIITP